MNNETTKLELSSYYGAVDGVKLEPKTEETPETVEETDVEEKGSFNPKDYSIIRDMIKEMDEWNKTLKDETHNILKNQYGLTNFAIVGIIPLTDEKIESLTLEQIKSFMENHKDANVNNLPEINTLEEGIQIMKEIKELQMNLYTADQEAEKLKAESQNILNDYFEYLSSPEVATARKNRLNKMKELAENEVDEVKKANMLRMIKSMEQADDMEFIFERFHENAVKESDSVITAFFDEKRGSYVIDRYKKKITKFGFDAKLYKYFFNLEENFLDEKYHAFNNLFLFYYMRYIAYADPYDKTDKLFVQSLTSAIANMIYHKFNSKIEEQKFIHIIEKFEDYFMDKHEYFMNNNTTRPGHPVREQASAKYEVDQKNRLIAKMEELGISGYDTSMTAKEMQKFFNDKMDEMLAAQKEERERKSKVTENEDGSITVEPDMNADNIETAFVTGMTTEPVTNNIEDIESVTTVASTEV